MNDNDLRDILEAIDGYLIVIERSAFSIKWGMLDSSSVKDVARIRKNVFDLRAAIYPIREEFNRRANETKTEL